MQTYVTIFKCCEESVKRTTNDFTSSTQERYECRRCGKVYRMNYPRDATRSPYVVVESIGQASDNA